GVIIFRKQPTVACLQQRGHRRDILSCSYSHRKRPLHRHFLRCHPPSAFAKFLTIISANRALTEWPVCCLHESERQAIQSRGSGPRPPAGGIGFARQVGASLTTHSFTAIFSPPTFRGKTAAHGQENPSYPPLCSRQGLLTRMSLP